MAGKGGGAKGRGSVSRIRFGALIALGLAAAVVAACQSSTPSSQPTRALTAPETARLISSVGSWQDLSRLQGVLEIRALDARLASAIDTWNLRNGLRLALANRTAGQEFIALFKGAASTGAATGTGGIELAAFRPGQGSVGAGLALPVVNQCAVNLPGQGNPPPVSRATLRWLSGQPAVDPNAPPPVSEETLQWIEEHAADLDPAVPPPVSEETLQWIEDHATDVDPANPPPVSDETLQWIEDHESSDPPPVSDETLQWIEEQEAANPPPVSDETLQWIEEQEASNPPPVSEETLQWIEEHEAATPPPVSEETLQWIEEHAGDPNPGDPPPVSEETLQWIEEHAGDVDPANPPPVSEETLRWIEEQDAAGASPGSSQPAASPQPTARTCAWLIDEPSGGGRIHGQKCGDPTGQWIVEGTYDRGGMQGDQQWTIAIAADQASGTFTYHTSAKGNPGGAPVTVYLDGSAAGNVTMTFGSDGAVHMRLVETEHSYKTKTSVGGWGISIRAANETYRFDWLVGGTC